MNLPTPQGATGPGASGAASAWDRAADGWDRSTPLIHAWLAPATAAMLARLRLRPGARVLDLAAGAGDQTKDVAQAVGPTGHVLATDISPRILAFAQRNLGAAGLAHVRYAVADAEQAVPGEAPFDAVLCRLGLMLCANPAAALASAFEALRPGGRFAALVFGEPAHNPCITTLMRLARQHRGLNGGASPYTAGGLFSLAEPGRLAGLLAAAGYADIEVEPLAAPFALPDVATYIGFVRDSGSPIMELLAPLDPSAQAAAWQAMAAALQPFTGERGWVGPNELLLCSATRPLTH